MAARDRLGAEAGCFVAVLVGKDSTARHHCTEL